MKIIKLIQIKNIQKTINFDNINDNELIHILYVSFAK